jgi:DNA-binding NarL/FixJ family response regulator
MGIAARVGEPTTEAQPPAHGGYEVTRILIIVAVRLYREGLAQLLGTAEGFTVVGTEADGSEVRRGLDRIAPDVALVEMGLPDVDEIVRTLAQRSPRIPVVALGITDSDGDVLTCAERGIAGYITRDGSIAELTATIRGVLKGELICSARTAGTLIRRLGELAAGRSAGSTVARLTRREREIAVLMGEDLSNKEIASRLCIEVATVKNHVHNVLDKLRVHRRADAARLLASETGRALGRWRVGSG